MPKASIDALEGDAPVTITGSVLTTYLREAYRQGAYMQIDHFVWHNVADLLDKPRAR